MWVSSLHYHKSHDLLPYQQATPTHLKVSCSRAGLQRRFPSSHNSSLIPSEGLLHLCASERDQTNKGVESIKTHPPEGSQTPPPSQTDLRVLPSFLPGLPEHCKEVSLQLVQPPVLALPRPHPHLGQSKGPPSGRRPVGWGGEVMGRRGGDGRRGEVLMGGGGGGEVMGRRGGR